MLMSEEKSLWSCETYMYVQKLLYEHSAIYMIQNYI